MSQRRKHRRGDDDYDRPVESLAWTPAVPSWDLPPKPTLKGRRGGPVPAAPVPRRVVPLQVRDVAVAAAAGSRYVPLEPGIPVALTLCTRCWCCVVDSNEVMGQHDRAVHPDL